MTERIKKILKLGRTYIAAFLIPAVLVYLAYAFFGLYPFGERSLLVLDLNGQYVYYFEALRAAFHGNGSVFYDWSGNLSGGFMGTVGYYLASPFSYRRFLCMWPMQYSACIPLGKRAYWCWT